MIWFDFFERLGVAVAAISERSDGDCSGKSGGLDARKRCLAQCGISNGPVACVRQVHGAQIIHAGAGNGGYPQTGLSPFPPSPASLEALPKADGLITNTRGLPLAVFVADCAPVYLYDPRTGAGGLLHAGREGTLHNIAGAAVAALHDAWDMHPEDLHALIGPAAGPCCYEVAPAMAAVFAEAGLPARGRHLDLWEANAQQLERAGVPRNHIEIAGICTICDTRFHSYRRDNTTKRNMAILVI